MFLAELCAEVRNYFETDKRFGEFTISGGTFAPSDFIKDGQYFRIVGSTFNDGVYRYPATGLTDEIFTGAVWAMSLPPDFIALSTEIEEYNKSDAGKASPYISENFGGYGYTKATGSNGKVLTWKSVFADDLNRYRKL